MISPQRLKPSRSYYWCQKAKWIWFSDFIQPEQLVCIDLSLFLLLQVLRHAYRTRLHGCKWLVFLRCINFFRFNVNHTSSLLFGNRVSICYFNKLWVGLLHRHEFLSYASHLFSKRSQDVYLMNCFFSMGSWKLFYVLPVAEPWSFSF